MLNREECEKALDILEEQHDYLRFNMQSNYPYTIALIEKVQNCFKQLIKEHFELAEKYKKLEKSDASKEECTIEQHGEIKRLRSELKQLQDEVDKYKHEHYSMCDLLENQ